MSGAVIQVAAGLLLVAGALFSLVAAIGIVRLPDLYTRMHAASKAGSVGAGLMLLALALDSRDLGVASRALAAIVFLLLTTPIAAHLLARAAYLAGVRPGPLTQVDELAERADAIPRDTQPR